MEIKMREEREQDYQNKAKENKRKTEEKERRFVEIHGENSEIAKEVPETLEYLSGNLQYKGVFGEADRRFRDRQIARSIKARRGTVTEAKSLVQELAELRRGQADLNKAFYESEAEERKLDVKRRRMEKGEIEEQAEIEMDIEKLELQSKREELKTRIEAQAKMRDSESEKLSPLETTEKQIEMIRARSEGLEMAKKAYQEDMENAQDEEVKAMKKRMWNDLIMELMEK